MKTINELIEQYRQDAKRVRERISYLKIKMKQDPDHSNMVDYRRRIETLYEEHGDLMFAIEQMLPYREEAMSHRKASGEY